MNETSCVWEVNNNKKKLEMQKNYTINHVGMYDSQLCMLFLETETARWREMATEHDCGLKNTRDCELSEATNHRMVNANCELKPNTHTRTQHAYHPHLRD